MADGLSSNMVTDVVQDGDGYLWIATDDGLNRYDGTEIRTFYANSNQSNTLPNNYIHRLILLDSFHLAIATTQGLSILDTRNLRFHNIYFTLHDLNLPGYNQPEASMQDDEKKLWEAYHNVILCMEKDASGNLWLGTRASLLCLNKQLQLIHVFYRHIQPYDLYGRRLKYVWKIIPLSAMQGVLVLLNLPSAADPFTAQAHRTWFLCRTDRHQMIPISRSYMAEMDFLNQLHYDNQCFRVCGHYLLFASSTHDSLYVWDESTKRKAVCRFLDSRIWNSNRLIPLLEQISDIGNGWMVLSYQTQGLSFVRLQDTGGSLSLVFYPKVYFPQYTFRKIFSDGEGNWWLTTEMEGLLKASPDKQNFKSFGLETGNRRHEVIFMYRYKNKLLIADYGNGLYDLDLSTQELTHFLFYYPHSRLLNQLLNMIWNIRHERGDTFWLGTQMGLMWYDIRNNHSGRILQPHPGLLDTVPVTTQFTDSKGLVWMGMGLGHGLCIYDVHRQKFQLIPNHAGGYPFRYPTGIAEDENSDIWLVNDDVGSLVQWIRKTRQFQVVTPEVLKGKITAATGAICMDHQHNIWYAVDPVGIIQYNPKSQETRVYGTGQGLNIGTARGIMEYEQNIWFATTKGISCYHLNRHTFSYYTELNGLPVSYFTGNFYVDSTTHLVYLCTLGGIIRFNPDRMRVSSSPLSVRITDIFLGNKIVDDFNARQIRIPYQDNDISVFFTGINLTNGKSNIYAYRLDEGNRTGSWINIGHQRQIRLANLAPGSYHLYIKAARSGGEWSPDVVHLDFMVATPFTRSFWFYLLLVCCGLGMIYGWYRYRIHQLVKFEYMRTQISHDLHDEIGSHLTTIGLTALLAQEKLHQNLAGQSGVTGQLNDLLKRIADDSRLVSDTMREIVWTINPRNDSFIQVLPFLIRYASQVLEFSNIEVHASINNTDGFKMNMYEKRDLVLIFKEATHNIVKHAEATRVQIVFEKKHNIFSLLIADDGKGFNPEDHPWSNGLYNMKARAIRHNWLLEINTSPGTGTQVILYFKPA
ncbi:two component regulator with propeller domain [Thermoflavifilum aggregans]|uniref:histidine kinase n=2 Tax=Thermoflavifilum aggregans TaxID=454188 RepID=A0A2M9CW57_9BACT|nr:two component regulator with propeller domain [Thermoflavifilum aggregans]